MIDHARTQSLFRKLEKLLTHQGSASPERVHHVRTTVRRLEAVLQVCFPEPTSRLKKLERALKTVRRRAGRVRDLDVQMSALRGLKIGREGDRKSNLLSHLAEEREAAEQKFQKTLAASLSGKLMKRLDRTAKDLSQLSASPKPGQPVKAPAWLGFEPVSASLRMFARASRESKTLTPENLHSFRTRCKRIRYVTEMAGNTPEAKRIAGELKRLQDAIGDWHDWLTLTETAEDLFSRSLGSALVAALRNITSAKFVEAKTVAENVRRELMREYRELLAIEREKRQRLAGGRKPAASSRRKPVASVPKGMAIAKVA